MGVTMHTQSAAKPAARPAKSSTEPRSELEVATRTREERPIETDDDDDLYGNLAHTD